MNTDKYMNVYLTKEQKDKLESLIIEVNTALYNLGNDADFAYQRTVDLFRDIITEEEVLSILDKHI